jgi:N-methylhydantoinase B
LAQIATEKDEQSQIAWDGKVHSYRAQADWLTGISPKLELHRDAADDLDPVTFEVIRNRLWNSNLAHGETLTRISGSPVFQALDFNMCICSEDAQLVINAPFIQHLVLGAPLAIRYVMEHFADAPGIEEGDVYLTNDCWISCLHQMDVVAVAPVFVDGRLFAWVSNAGHHYDLGGNTPGGWTQNARDVFGDPVMFAPFKIVEKGVLRKDLDEMFIRHSRVPDLVALDLRAQMSGVRYAVQELQAVCEEFGALTVKAAMRRILDNAEHSFRDKLRRIPDGTWSEVRYVDEKLPGDRASYRTQVNITKRGDEMIVDNKGTDPQQEGPIGFVYAGFCGALFGAVSISMLTEHLFAVGGAERAIQFDPTPGLLSCVDWPAPVAGGIMNGVNYMMNVSLILSRMMACDPDLKKDIIGQQIDWPNLALEAVNDRGEYQGTGLFESAAQGSAGKPNRDGTDTTGTGWSPLFPLLNAEDLEQYFPIAYLYRHERTDGGGVGRWRGGAGMDVALIPYRARSLSPQTNVGGAGVSTHGGGTGLFGGYPCPTTRFTVLRGTDLQDRFGRGDMPIKISDIEAEEQILLRGKSDGTPMGPYDVLEFSFAGGGGYGDPLERDPASVVADIELGYQSAGVGESVYGVVRGKDGVVDEEATVRRRDEIRAEREGWTRASELLEATAPPSEGETPATGEPPRSVHETVVSRDQDGQRVLACSRCSTALADYRGSYKHGLLVDECSTSIIPGNPDPKIFIDDPIVFRRFCCPGCYVLMTTEIVRSDDPIYPEFVLA